MAVYAFKAIVQIEAASEEEAREELNSSNVLTELRWTLNYVVPTRDEDFDAKLV